MTAHTQPTSSVTTISLIATAGFALFSMFFGSGNLVFPLLVGVESLSQSGYAAAGLLVTGVLIPFLGLIGMVVYGGSKKAFFEPMGPLASFVLIALMLGLMGPLGVVPRCVLVAYGGAQLLFPTLSLSVFAALYSVLTFVMVWKRSRLIDIIGQYLTPLLLGGILVLIAVALWQSPERGVVGQEVSTQAIFTNGLMQGYQTMDLMAAFFFSASTMTYIRHKMIHHHQADKIVPFTLAACVLGALLLGIIYVGLVHIGAAYSVDLKTIPAECMLVWVAQKTLGSYALPVASLVIFLACLTTSTVLASLFTDFVHEDVIKRKFPRDGVLCLTLALAYALSLLGFSVLAGYIAQTLTVIYPALIVYTTSRLIPQSPSRRRLGAWLFWGTAFATLALRAGGGH